MNISSENYSTRGNLLCPCHFDKYSDLTPRGFLIEKRPVHHGKWDKTKPLIKMSDTDYFWVNHSGCDGEMKIYGIYIEPENSDSYIDGLFKIILSLKCDKCKYRDAIKTLSGDLLGVFSNRDDKTWVPIDLHDMLMRV